MKGWLDLMSGVGHEAVDRELDRIRSEDFAFDALVHWGPNGVVRRYCFERGLGYVASELGAMRSPFPHSFYLDPLGCHGQTIVACAGEVVAELPNVCSILAVRERLELPSQSRTRTAKALVALQLADDANSILSRSGWSPSDYVTFAVPLLLNAGFEVTVKGHPGAGYRNYNLAAQDEALSLASGRFGCTTITATPAEVSYSDWLREFDIVASMSSSISFEAALCGTIGAIEERASYAPDEVFPKLEQAIRYAETAATPSSGVEHAIAFYVSSYAIYGIETMIEKIHAAAEFSLHHKNLRDNAAALLVAWNAVIGPGRAVDFGLLPVTQANCCDPR
jgi:hypothetical protein